MISCATCLASSWFYGVWVWGVGVAGSSAIIFACCAACWVEELERSASFLMEGLKFPVGSYGLLCNLLCELLVFRGLGLGCRLRWQLRDIFACCATCPVGELEPLTSFLMKGLQFHVGSHGLLCELLGELVGLRSEFGGLGSNLGLRLRAQLREYFCLLHHLVTAGIGAVSLIFDGRALIPFEIPWSPVQPAWRDLGFTGFGFGV